MSKATRLLSLADYTRAFGAPHPKSDLAASVNQFFANGGTDCYVIRIAHNPVSAAVTLRSLDGKDVLRATAKSEGVWANTLRMEVDYNTTAPDDTFNLRVILEEAGNVVATESFPNLSMNPVLPRYAPTFVSQSSELIDLAPTTFLTTNTPDVAQSMSGFSLGMRPLGANAAGVQTFLNGLVNAALPADVKSRFEISVDGSAFVPVDLHGWTVPAAIATMNTDLTSIINNALLSLGSPVPTVSVVIDVLPDVTTPAVSWSQGNLLRITANNGDASSVRIRRVGANDLAVPLMLGVDQGGIEVARYSNFRPAPTASYLTLGGFTAGGVGVPGTQGLDNLVIITEMIQNKITGMSLDGIAIAGLSVVTSGGTQAWIRSATGYSPATGENDGVREKLRIIATKMNQQAGLPYRGDATGYHLSIVARTGNINQQPVIAFTGVSTNPANLLGTITRNVKQYTLGVGGSGSFSTGGTDGFDGDVPTASDYVGDPVNQNGMHALDSVDLFNLMVIPGDSEVTETVQLSLWGPASNYCESRRAFLLIDAPASWTTQPGVGNPLPRPGIVNNLSHVDTDVRNTVSKQYSAVFYPRLVYTDGGILKRIGAGGAIAGLMARTDVQRGVWKAPAGTEADIRGIVGLEVNLTDPENGVLNKVGVNCLRVFPNGFVNWGARTMDGNDDFGSEWKYIPIRRFALFLEESLFRGTKWVVFEPNDEPLWAKIRLNLNAFMMGLFRQGAFQGSTPDKAFFVRCDSTTTTQNDRNLGIVNIEVGFAPLKPAEFVVIKIQQIAGDL
ncbi:MAG: phage tail sheath family protein [Bacteroidetes bacterium]|nr:phage tail sheath family protein [Bacteroidota bacterium]